MAKSKRKKPAAKVAKAPAFLAKAKAPQLEAAPAKPKAKAPRGQQARVKKSKRRARNIGRT